MSEVKHTPGPWYAKPGNSMGDMDVRSKNDPHPSLYCRVSVGWGPDAERVCLDNANLIAAAPELLEALIQCRAVLVTALSEQPNPTAVLVIERKITLADAAIAKAKGRAVE